jgi:hypothetical protein
MLQKIVERESDDSFLMVFPEPENEPLTVDFGTVEEFTKALAVVNYLAAYHGMDSSFVIRTDYAKSTIADQKRGRFIISTIVDPYFQRDLPYIQVIDDLIEAFHPRGTVYKYAGKPYGWMASQRVVYCGQSHVEEELPTVRDRLEARTWLLDLFRRMNINPRELEKVFPLRQHA